MPWTRPRPARLPASITEYLYLTTVVWANIFSNSSTARFILALPGRHELTDLVRENVRKGSEVITDELLSYDGLDSEYAHKIINHAESYVDGNVHTNRMENFLSLLK